MAVRAKEKHPFSSSATTAFFPSFSKLARATPATKPSLLHKSKLLLSISLLLSLWLIATFYCFPSSTTTPGDDQCDPVIAPFYIYDLPDRFNAALLRQCHSLSPYTDMCPHVSHRGLGRPIRPSWYATHQFLAEMIFHARAEHHPCRVSDPSTARLFYVPFYAGLYASSQFSQPNHTLRDALANDLLHHLSLLPTWRRRSGQDHFFAIGRTAWDFMRSDSPSTADFGANRLLLETANATVLTVERHPWDGLRQRGIPYPSYFHPKTRREMDEWQEEVRRSERTHLYAFVGGPRVGLEKAAVRAEILRQCGESSRCLRVECAPGARDCHDPDQVVAVLRRAEFCMQPAGDSFTRRSVFDAVLAGCVPVFFSEHTAYTQYGWYLPPSKEWSVMIGKEGWGRIEEELGRIPRGEVERMRERVVGMIPAVTYAQPEARRREVGFRDAVDVALVELSRMVIGGGVAGEEGGVIARGIGVWRG